MNEIVLHLEYLLRRHDCVVLPGIGAFIVGHRPAFFDDDDPCLLFPPQRSLVFNGVMTGSDGLLERSMARRAGVSFEAARRIVNEEVEALRMQLVECGSLTLGHLGSLTFNGESVGFAPGNLSDWDLNFHDLIPLRLSAAEEDIPGAYANAENGPGVITLSSGIRPYDQPEENDGNHGSSIWRKVANIAASVAVVALLAYFFINPVSVTTPSREASIAPSATVIKGDASREAATPIVGVATPGDTAAQIVNEVCLNQAPKANTPDALVTPLPSTTAVASPSTVSLRFDEADPYCVVVASLPSQELADQYMRENPRGNYGVLYQDGKYRVYAATGTTYQSAQGQKGVVGVDGAWICRK